AEQVATFPDASVAVKVTGVIPREYTPDPSAPFGVRLFWISTVGLHASAAVAARLTGAPCGLLHSVGPTVGQLSAGGIVSLTDTCDVQVATFPDPSFAVKVTGVVPNGYVPDASLP